MVVRNDMIDTLAESARSCVENARRLLLDAEYLEYGEPPVTAYFLTRIAQEEIAKAFLLALVVRDVIPWDPRLLRAARDHSCKQLIAIVMTHLTPNDRQFSEEIKRFLDGRPRAEVPSRVVDAIDILRHEKMGRWTAQRWRWDIEPTYDPVATATADGKADRRKQDALYVRLGRDGSVVSKPGDVTRDELVAERQRDERMIGLTESVLRAEECPALDYDKVAEMFRAVFATLPEDEPMQGES